MWLGESDSKPYINKLIDKLEEATQELNKYIIRNKVKQKEVIYDNKTMKPSKETILENEDIKFIEGDIDRNGLKQLTSSLKDLKEILSETVVDDILEYHLDSDKIVIDSFISDRLMKKIDEYNEKMNAQMLDRDKKTKTIEISPEGLELIEMISLDCTSKKGTWHSDEEVKIDKLGYIINKGQKTNDFWDGTVPFHKKPYRIKVRNISGDELIVIL